MKGLVELIIGLVTAVIAIGIVLYYVFPYVSGHTDPEQGGVKGDVATSTTGGSTNWKFDIIDKLIKSDSTPKRATVGPYIFTSSLEMLGHSFGAQVYQYYHITNLICCGCDRDEINMWKVCVVEACDQTIKELQVTGPPDVDTLSENDLYMVDAETGEDWICLRFQKIQ